jgi:putative flavoprotein involved in K+ transport
MEVVRSHKTIVSGRDTGHVPFRINGLAAQLFLTPLLLRFVFHRILTIKTPIGRKARVGILSKGGPLIRVKPADLAAAGVERVPRFRSALNGLPVLEDGRVLDVANVIWCTGYRPGFSWIDLPGFEPDAMPKHYAGVATGEPGLYFVGLPFIYAFSSTMIHGVGRDAERIAGVIKNRIRLEPSGVSVGPNLNQGPSKPTAVGYVSELCR